MEQGEKHVGFYADPLNDEASGSSSGTASPNEPSSPHISYLSNAEACAQDQCPGANGNCGSAPPMTMTGGQSTLPDYEGFANGGSWRAGQSRHMEDSQGYVLSPSISNCVTEIVDAQPSNSGAAATIPSLIPPRRRRHAGHSNMGLVLPRIRSSQPPRQPQHVDHSHVSGSPPARVASGQTSPGGTRTSASSPFRTTTDSTTLLEDQPDDTVTQRILSLPNVVCRSAGGDLFLVDLDDVQHMLHKRRIGTEGMKILAKHANSRQTINDPDSKKQLSSAGMLRRKLTVKGGLGETQATTVQAALRDGTGANAEQIDAEVLRHLELTSAKIEALRQQLALVSARKDVASPGQIAEAERLLREEESLKAVAAELVIKLAPRRRMQQPAGGHLQPNKELYARMQGALSNDVRPAAAAAPKSARWGKVADAVTFVDKYPFLEEWEAASRKLQRDESKGGSGWDELVPQNDVYVKGKVDLQGGTVYVMRCHELGVVPSTQVVQQLGVASSNMSHSKLGRRGATALRHALAANNTITHLNLSHNGFDAAAVGDIVRGLTAGTLANAPAARKQLNLRWQRLEFIKQKPAELSVNLQPIGLAKEKADVARSRHASPSRQARRAASNSDDLPLLPDDLPDEESTAEPEAGGTAAGGAGGGAAALAADEAPPAAEGAADQAEVGAVGEAAEVPLRLQHAANSLKPRAASSLNSSLLCQICVLDLSCNPFGIYGARVLAGVLDPALTPCQFLVALHLNKCSIPELGGIAIFRALANSNTALTTLSLANNMLGNKTAELMGEVLPSNRTLSDLNLAWNKIGPAGLITMCKGLAGNVTLRRLDLSWNGLENPGVMAVGTMLCLNAGLKVLDLTNTRMGSEACLLLGEGIRRNKTLEALILNSNAVGDDGARHLMNALRSNDSLQFLGLQGANMTSAARGHNAGAMFNPLSPDGSYVLDLHNLSDRSVAFQLCELDRASPHDLMRNIKCDGRNIASCRSINWPETLPAVGQMSCDFVSKRQKREMKLMDGNKFHALQAQTIEGGASSASMSDREKLGLVTIMAPFNYLTCEQVATMLSSFSICEEQVECAAVLLTRTIDLDINTHLITNALHENERRTLLSLLSWYINLRFDNCTGHYELSLSNPLHHYLAVRLKDVAYSENDSNNWINIIYDKAATTQKFPGNYGPPEGWRGIIPTSGMLTLDYISDDTAPGGSNPLADPAFLLLVKEQVLVEMDALGQPQPTRDFEEADAQIGRLRATVTGPVFFTCAQLILLVSCFEYGPHRVEAVTVLYAHTVDLKNFWTVLYSLRPLEQALASHRLGPANVFDRSHTSMHYVLDLSNPAHEHVAKQLVAVAAQNTEMPNFWNLRLQGTKRYISENRNMWGTFTADTFSPLLEFDFAGMDSFEALGRSRAEVEALLPGDRLDMRTKQMRRCEMSRIKQMYGYFEDGSGWIRPSWQSKNGLFKPHIDKPPWLASWDRTLRILYRCDKRSGDIEADSYLEDIFDEYTKGEEFLAVEEFDLLLKNWGYNKAEIVHHYDKEFESAARPPDDAPDTAPVIDFQQFVPIMMSEPAHAMRLVRDRDAAPAEENAAVPRNKSMATAKPLARGKSGAR